MQNESVAKKLKHLDFLQLVITRMNINSFLLKGWAITLVSALTAFAAKDSNPEYILITYIATPLFWLLDAYYLAQERQYRCLYNVVKDKSEQEIDFDLNANPFNNGRNTWHASFFAPTLFIFYGILILITVIIMFIIN